MNDASRAAAAKAFGRSNSSAQGNASAAAAKAALNRSNTNAKTQQTSNEQFMQAIHNDFVRKQNANKSSSVASITSHGGSMTNRTFRSPSLTNRTLRKDNNPMERRNSRTSTYSTTSSTDKSPVKRNHTMRMSMRDGSTSGSRRRSSSFSMFRSANSSSSSLRSQSVDPPARQKPTVVSSTSTTPLKSSLKPPSINESLSDVSDAQHDGTGQGHAHKRSKVSFSDIMEETSKVNTEHNSVEHLPIESDISESEEKPKNVDQTPTVGGIFVEPDNQDYRKQLGHDEGIIGGLTNVSDMDKIKSDKSVKSETPNINQSSQAEPSKDGILENDAPKESQIIPSETENESLRSDESNTKTKKLIPLRVAPTPEGSRASQFLEPQDTSHDDKLNEVSIARENSFSGSHVSHSDRLDNDSDTETEDDKLRAQRVPHLDPPVMTRFDTADTFTTVGEYADAMESIPTEGDVDDAKYQEREVPAAVQEAGHGIARSPDDENPKTDLPEAIQYPVETLPAEAVQVPRNEDIKEISSEAPLEPTEEVQAEYEKPVAENIPTTRPAVDTASLDSLSSIEQTPTAVKAPTTPAKKSIPVSAASSKGKAPANSKSQTKSEEKPKRMFTSLRDRPARDFESSRFVSRFDRSSSSDEETGTSRKVARKKKSKKSLKQSLRASQQRKANESDISSDEEDIFTDKSKHRGGFFHKNNSLPLLFGHKHKDAQTDKVEISDAAADHPQNTETENIDDRQGLNNDHANILEQPAFQQTDDYSTPPGSPTKRRPNTLKKRNTALGLVGVEPFEPKRKRNWFKKLFGIGHKEEKH